MFKLVVLTSVLALASSSAIAPLGWAGQGWAGRGWAGNGWAGNGWARNGWAGNGWAGNGWAGNGWTGSVLAAPAVAPVAVAAPLAVATPVNSAYNYRGPLSLAPGQPADILATDGRPLDTLSVNLDRAAHYTAKAVDAHVLHKRSAVLAAAPVAWSRASPVVAPLAAAPLVGAWSQAAPWGTATVWGGRHW